MPSTPDAAQAAQSGPEHYGGYPLTFRNGPSDGAIIAIVSLDGVRTPPENGHNSTIPIPAGGWL